MKKNQPRQFRAGLIPISAKLAYYMKVSGVLWTLMLLSLSSQAFSQKISVDLQNASFRAFLTVLQKQTRVALMYNDNLIKDKRISLRVEGILLEDLLKTELPKHGLSYSRKNNQITIVPHKIEGVAVIESIPVRNPVIQEEIKIKGRVFTNTEPPQALAHASVAVLGTSKGVLTDEAGYYEIALQKGQTLVFTMVGYASKQVVVSKAETNLTVSLELDVSELEEVVVVGMTEMQRKHIASSVASLDVKSNIAGKPITNLSQSLQGGVTGLQVQQGSGLPGGDAASIKIRGISTLNNAEPLVLVDGVPMDMNHIDPVTVESVTILKDAAAAAIYGARAANGVILVTTKRGKAGQINILYDGYYGMQTPTILPEFVDAPTYMKMYNYAVVASGGQEFYTDEQISKTIAGDDPINYPNTNWTKELIDEYSPITSHSLAVSGGNDVARFAVTGNYMSQKGMLPLNNTDRFNIRANTSVSLSKKFLINLDVLGIRRNTMYPNRPISNGGSRMLDDLYRLEPTILPKYPQEEGWPTIYGRYADIVNPIAYKEVGGTIGYQYDQATINMQPKWTITDNLSLRGQFSYRLNNDVYKQKRDNFYFFDYYTKQLVQTWGVQRDAYSELRDTYFFLSGALDYNKDFGRHSVFAMGGFSSEKFNNGYWNMSALVSAYTKVNYSFDDRYLAEISFRADGSSKFGPGNKFGYFPSLALGWNLHNEKFFEIDAINNFKIRASYGQLGNENIGLYKYQNLINTSNGTESVWGNPNVSWEKVNILDLGFDLALFNSKLSMTFDYYDKRTSDVLLMPAVAPSGAVGSAPINAGEVMNRGYEFSFNYNGNFSEDFLFSVKPGITYNKNKITDILGGPYISGIEVNEKGSAIKSYYGYLSDGILQYSDFEEDRLTAKVPLAGKQGPGDIKYVDLNADGIIDENDQRVMGDPTPRINYFANFNFTYKNLDLEFLLQGAGNHDYSGNLGGKSAGYLWHPLNLSASGGVPTTYRAANTWNENNQDAIYPRLLANPAANVLRSDFWLFNAKYMRVKFIQLGYRLNSKAMNKYGIKSSRIYLNAQNPLLITGLKMADPESQGGSYTHPIMKTFSVGVTANF
ncbi:SusC/RagA family TonB-linked outer membrane protein [Sphingobacterium sp. SYP-B4668]|uniref:SusC/RagA family TonB-linked outer membrane protein n=1 Tax=Sphingobacterium sp. SYP-B4668 TaxID=2996035 RepID=UPI0022DDF815|nr:TonB-dependent receptor [Sphingobacterium sp. SYP-B4668]